MLRSDSTGTTNWSPSPRAGPSCTRVGGELVVLCGLGRVEGQSGLPRSDYLDEAWFLSFDGATGAYEDKIMQRDHVGPFELMFNIQLGKAILAFLSLVIFNEVNYFLQMVQETGPVLLALGVTGAMGQVFIFVTIAKFGALMCSLIGLGRKIVTLIVSIIIYQHPVDTQQGLGLSMAVGAMVYNFADRGGKRKAKPPTVAARDVEEADGVELKGLLAAEGTLDEDETVGEPSDR